MNKLAAFLLLTALSPNLTSGQGTTYLSNLGEPSFASEPVSSNLSFGALFLTGTSQQGYELNSVQLLMSPASGGPGGFAVSIFTSNNGLPDSAVGSLSGPDPALGGPFSYQAAGLTLLPSTLYFVVVTASSANSQGYYNWNRASNSDFVSSDGWGSGLGYHYYNGSSWHAVRSEPFQFAISATAIPEPSSIVLFLCGGALIFASRRSPIPESKTAP